jgi:methionine salvage enolase-phosphatase E1
VVYQLRIELSFDGLSTLLNLFFLLRRNKKEARSYKEIYLTVGVDHPSCITFATDVLAEAVAAKEAGLFS